MKKYLLIISLLSLQLRGLCQYTEFRRLDSLRVDSLRKSLPGLEGQEKINALNKLSEMFASFNAMGGFIHRADSMYYYGLEANKESTRLDYKYGLANSLLNLSNALKYGRRFDKAKDPAEKKYLLHAIQIGEELDNDSILGSAYYLLAGHGEMEVNYKKAISHFQKAGDLQKETEVTTWLCMSYSNKSQYEEGFPYCDRCIPLARKNVASNKTDWSHELVQWSLYDMAQLYKAAGDYETTMYYYEQLNQYAEENHLEWTIPLNKAKAELFLMIEQFDSAFYHWQNWEKHREKNTESYSIGQRALDNTSLGLIYLKINQPDKALPLFAESIQMFTQMGKKESGYAIIKPLLFTSEFYLQKKKFTVALKYTNEAYLLSKEDNRRTSIMDCYEMFSKIYHNLGENDSAYSYLSKYTALKDSIFTRQLLWRLNNYKKAAQDAKKESRIGFLNRDNQIKQQQLKQQATFRNFLIAAFIAIIFAGLYVFRNINLKRKNEKLKQDQNEQEWKLKQLENENKHVELQRQAVELEMQALRAQMNPHFIFNCLSSINRFILKNEGKTASGYLTRFSRLMRMVLMNSQKSLIALEDELQMLELYLEMERLRFKSSFDYGITYLNAVDSDNIFIPPLLLQPFCENAIWHGLMHLPAGRHGKEGQGRLDIELSMEDKVLICVISDNGVGREKAEEMKSKTAEKEKSMGLKITTERLALLNRENGLHTFYEIEDLKDENGIASGTKVTLQISFKESAEQPVSYSPGGIGGG